MAQQMMVCSKTNILAQAVASMLVSTPRDIAVVVGRLIEKEKRTVKVYGKTRSI